jgi:hypothetical protein
MLITRYDSEHVGYRLTPEEVRDFDRDLASIKVYHGADARAAFLDKFWSARWRFIADKERSCT